MIAFLIPTQDADSFCAEGLCWRCVERLLLMLDQKRPVSFARQ